MRTITDQELLDTLSEIIESRPEKGETLYETVYKEVTGKGGGYACFNLHRKAGEDKYTPLCIAGQVYAKLLTPEEFEVMAPEILGGYVYDVAHKLRRANILTFSDVQILALQRAQRVQDNGDTWGIALQEAAATLS